MRNLAVITFLLLFAGCASKGGGGSSGSVAAAGPATVRMKSVQLSWSASTGSPTGYSVEQSTNNASFSSVTTVSGTAATIVGLTSGRTYYFRVKGYNAGGYSPASNVITVSP